MGRWSTVNTGSIHQKVERGNEQGKVDWGHRGVGSEVGVCNRVIRVGLMAVKRRLEGGERFCPVKKWEKNIPGRGDSLSDSPQA